MYHLIFQPTVSTFNQGTLYFSHQTHSSPIAATIFKLKFKCFVDFYLEWCLDLFGKKEKKKRRRNLILNLLMSSPTAWLRISTGAVCPHTRQIQPALHFYFFFVLNLKLTNLILKFVLLKRVNTIFFNSPVNKFQ